MSEQNHFFQNPWISRFRIDQVDEQSMTWIPIKRIRNNSKSVESKITDF